MAFAGVRWRGVGQGGGSPVLPGPVHACKVAISDINPF